MKRKFILILLVSLFSSVAIAQNVGIGTTNPLARLHVTDSAVLFTGPSGLPPSFTTINPPVQGAGTRMFWFPALGAFRTGYVDAAQWNRVNIGLLSFATGYNTQAKAVFSTSLGRSTTASNSVATSMGFGTIASGEVSTSMGNGSAASGFTATSMGRSTLASGDFSTSMGDLTVASGVGALASGGSAIASGNYASSLGEQTVAKARGGFTTGVWNDNTDTPNDSTTASTDRIFQIGNGDGITRSNAVTVLRNGNTGIGTPLPYYPLHVQKSAPYSFVASIENQDPEGWGLEVRTKNVSSAKNALQVYTGNSIISRFIVRNDGNVGVGVTDPSFILDVGARMRIRSGGDLNNSAGLFFNNTLNTDIPAFIGMQNNEQVGFYGNNSGWSFVMNTSTGKIGIGTTSPASTLEVNGFTKLGSSAPAIKVKKLTGTTASFDGGTVNIPHGLTFSKIISVSILVESGVNNYTPPSFTALPGLEYNFDILNNNFWVFNVSGNSGNILSKSFTALITYEE
jgi:hypothetical protein